MGLKTTQLHVTPTFHFQGVSELLPVEVELESAMIVIHVHLPLHDYSRECIWNHRDGRFQQFQRCATCTASAVACGGELVQRMFKEYSETRYDTPWNMEEWPMSMF